MPWPCPHCRSERCKGSRCRADMSGVAEFQEQLAAARAAEWTAQKAAREERERARSSRFNFEQALRPDEKWHIFDVHPGWALAGGRVTDLPSLDESDTYVDISALLTEDVDYVDILATAPTLTSPWGLRRRLKEAA